MTRIAVLSTDPGIAWDGTKGAAVHLRSLTAALARHGAEVLVLVAAAGATGSPAGVRVEVLPGRRKHTPVVARLAAEPALAAWIEERIRSFGAQALYERLALHSAAGSRAARSVGLPHVVELNAPLVEEAAGYRRLEQGDDARRLEREVLVAADLVVAVSRPLAAHAAERGARAVEVVPNAVDLSAFQDDDPPAGPAAAVLAGTLRPWHGVDMVVEAWRLLGAARPPLLVVGDGPGRERLEAAGAVVTGPVAHERVPPLLRTATIGLAPYAVDAPRYFSPLKVFEYLAAGLATVAVDLPGVVDVAGDAVVLVPAGSAEALAAAVARLAADPAERRRLGAAGRACVAAGHTWDHRADTLLDRLRALTGGVAARGRP